MAKDLDIIRKLEKQTGEKLPQSEQLDFTMIDNGYVIDDDGYVIALSLCNTELSDILPLAGLTNLTQLKLFGCQLNDISVFSGFTNLTELNLNRCKIKDISVLSALTNLKSLNLWDNQISDISGLSGLTNLTELNLSRCEINDISVLSGLTNLARLILWGNQLSDISVLSGLTNLTKLNLGSCNINDISVLSSLTNLTSLTLWDNQISDISGLSDLTNLTELNLGGCQLSDISVLSGLTNLTKLNLSRCEINDISVFSGLTNLTSLNLWDNQISDISVLSGLTNLIKMDLSGNNISDISVLSGLTNLIEMDLSKNNISDFSVLSGLTNLTKLDLNRCQISDISVLSGLTNLTRLDLWDNQISDISVLSGLTNLTRLALWDNQISDITVLSCLTNLTELNLSRCKISDISVLSRLTNLTKLILSRCQFDDISVLSGLTNLTRLTLGSCQISDISVLSGLTNLTRLALWDNQISDITVLSGLTNLTQLNLSRCKIKDISVLSGLANLTRLDLSRCQISDISALSGLMNLKRLDLTANKIRVLPKWILELEMEINFTEKQLYEDINLFANPLEIPPVSVVKQGKESIRLFFEDMGKGKDYLYEAKLILVGEERAGKTTLSRSLIDPNFDFEKSKEEVKSTRGIDIGRWELEPEDFDKKNNFHLNLWDFGGQEIYHDTHQFFLTKRSLYLLVQQARKDMRHEDYYYWLNCIEILGEKSPTIVVINKCDQPVDRPPLEEYRQRFEFITDYCETSCINEQKDTIETLKTKLKNVLLDRTLLPHIGDPLPKNWVDVRKEMGKLRAEGNDYISIEEYYQICSRHSLNKIQSDYLLPIFHDLGAVLYFGDDLILEKTVFLNYEFVTDAVYKVLDNEKVKKQFGEFKDYDLKKIWNEPKYNDKRAELLELMKHDRFELCYELHRGGYMAPQLLPRDMPTNMKDYERQLEEPLCYEFHYTFMPKGILPRLIVRLKKYVQLKKCWRSGMIADYDGSRAYVREHYFDRKIVIFVDGPNKKELLSNIQYNIRDINETFRQLNVEERVPCICEECRKNWAENSSLPSYYKRSDLDRRRTKNVQTIQCENSYQDVNVEELLGIAIINIIKETGTRIINVGRDYIEGDSMKIDKQVNKDVENVMNADKIINQYGLDEHGIREVVGAIGDLVDKEKELLREYFKQLNNVKGKNVEAENNMAKKIKTFLVNSGIAIAQNLTASGIYDVCTKFFG